MVSGLFSVYHVFNVMCVECSGGDTDDHGSLYLSPTTPTTPFANMPSSHEAVGGVGFPPESHRRHQEQVQTFTVLVDIMNELSEILRSLGDPHNPPHLFANLLQTALGMVDRMRTVALSAAEEPAHPHASTHAHGGDHKHTHHHGDHHHHHGHTPSDVAHDVEKSFKSLVNRMRTLESDFAEENIPEKHLTLLRDLRMRIVELEKNLVAEFEAEKAAWEREREQLLRSVQHRGDEVRMLLLLKYKLPCITGELCCVIGEPVTHGPWPSGGQYSSSVRGCAEPVTRRYRNADRCSQGADQSLGRIVATQQRIEYGRQRTIWRGSWIDQRVASQTAAGASGT
jgi:hypothetical protein